MRTIPVARSIGLGMLLTLATLTACSDEERPTAPVDRSTPRMTVAPTLLVSNTDDSGPGSLRQAFADATGGEIVQFDTSIAGGTILLTSGPLKIGKPLTVEGPASRGMTISGGLTDRVLDIAVAGDVVLRNLTITNGRAAGGAGILAMANLVLDHSLVANNQAIGTPGVGGGIYATGGPGLTLINSTVSGNTAYQGSGIIADNTPLILRNSTVAMNSAASGAGVLANNVVSLRNSIIAQNLDAAGQPGRNCQFLGTPQYSGVNISDNDSCGPSPAVRIAYPVLAPLADNGGPTRTHALGLTSLAIDGGTLCTEDTDQRYVTRPQGTTCDVGAYEFNDWARVTVSPNPNATVDPTNTVTVSGTIACSVTTTAGLSISLSQTQKVTGKFPTIVQGSATITRLCSPTPSSWSVTVSGGVTGEFVNGAATVTVRTYDLLPGWLGTPVTSSVKLFNVK